MDYIEEAKEIMAEFLYQKKWIGVFMDGEFAMQPIEGTDYFVEMVPDEEDDDDYEFPKMMPDLSSKLPIKLPEKSEDLENWLQEAREVISLRGKWLDFLYGTNFRLEMLQPHLILEIVKRTCSKEGFPRIYRSCKLIKTIIDEASHNPNLQFRKHGDSLNIQSSTSKLTAKFHNSLPSLKFFNLTEICFTHFAGRPKEELINILSLLKNSNVTFTNLKIAISTLYQELLDVLKPKELTIVQGSFEEHIVFPPELLLIGSRIEVEWFWRENLMPIFVIQPYIALLGWKCCSSNIKFLEIKACLFLGFCLSFSQEQHFQLQGEEWEYIILAVKSQVGAAVGFVFQSNMQENNTKCLIDYYKTYQEFKEAFDRFIVHERSQVESEVNTQRQSRAGGNHKCLGPPPFWVYNVEAKEAHILQVLQQKVFNVPSSQQE